MIAIDTNVLLRYLLDDDKAQSKKANTLICGSTKVLVTDVVLAETTWTLKGKRYNIDKEALIKVIQTLFEEPNIVFENGQSVWRAVNDYKNAKVVRSRGKRKEIDFPDALIINKAEHSIGAMGNPFDGVYTFDIAAQQLSGAKKP